MREVTLPSGALLKVNPAPFAESKALYQALLKELKSVEFSGQDLNLFKDLLCVGFSSPDIERALWKCMERCTYNDKGHNLKITPLTFEPFEARADYIQVCIEVAKDNVEPFTKALLQGYKTLSEMGAKSQK